MAEALTIEVVLQAIDKMTGPAKAAMGANQQLADALAKTRQRMAELDNAQRTFSGYTKLKEQISGVEGKMEAAQKKAQQLAIQLKNVDKNPTDSKLKDQLSTLTSKMETAQNKAQQLASQLKSLDNPSEKLQQQFAKASQEANRLADQHAKLTNKLAQNQQKVTAESEKLKQQFAQARQEVNRLDAEHIKLTRRLDQTRQKLTEAGVPMRSLTEAQRSLRQQTTETTAAMERQAAAMGKEMAAAERLANHQRQIGQMRNRMQNSLQLQQDIAGVAYPTLAAGSGMLYAASRPIMQAATLSDQVRDIAITGNMGKVEEAQLREQLRTIALKTNQEQAEISKGVQILVANGMNAKDASNYAELLGKAATASRASMDDIANVTFSLQNSLKIQGKDEMDKAMNNLVLAGKQGQFELKDMARYFPSLSAQMASMGATGQDAVKELAIAMQAARKASGTSQEAAANTANWFSHMTAGATIDHFSGVGIDLKAEMLKRMNNADPAKKMSALRASLDIFDGYIDKVTAGKKIEVRTPSGKLKDTLDFKSALTQATKTGSEDEVKRVVERFGLSAIIQDMQTANFYLAMRQNKKFIDDSLQGFDAKGAGDTLNNDMAKRLESPIEQFKAAKIAFTDSMTQVGDAILPMITPLIQQVTQITQKITQWAKANPELVATLLKIAGVVGVTMVAFGGIAMTIISVLGPLAMFRFALGMVGANLRFFSNLGNIGGLFRGLGGSISGAGGILKGFGQAVLSIGRTLMTGLSVGARAAGQAVLGLGRTLMTGIGAGARIVGNVIASLGRTLMSGLSVGVRIAGQAILWLGRIMLMNPIGLAVTVIAGAAYLIYRNWSTIKPMLAKFWSSIVANWASFKAWVGQFINDIKSKFTEGWNTIKAKTAKFSASFTTFFSGLPGRMMSIGTDIIQGLWNGLKSKMSAVLNSVSEFASNIASKVSGVLGIQSPSRVFMQLGGFTLEGLQVGLLRQQPRVMQQVTQIAQQIPAPIRQVANKAANDPLFGRLLGMPNQTIKPLPERRSNIIALPQRQQPSPATATSNQTISIVINAATGMDEKAIADAVARKLREIERNNSAKVRGAMYD